MRILILLLALQMLDADAILKRMAADLELLRSFLTKSSEVTVRTSLELQAALDGSAETILVQPGTYSGNFKARAKATKTVVLGVQFAGRATRMQNYPILAAAEKTAPTLSVGLGAHDYTFVGLEITGNAPTHNTVEVGVGAKTLAELPRNISFNKVYIHGVNGFGRRGIYFDAINGTVTGSYISEYLGKGVETQAIGIFGGVGPYLINNNYLEASGENILVGGVDPAIQGLIPSNITITNNTIFKPLHWKETTGSVKNLLELKNAQDVIISNNTLENVWVDWQSGSAVLFTPRNQDGKCLWCNVRNVKFSCNVIRNAQSNAVVLLGTDDIQKSATMENVVITNNWFDGVGSGIQVNGGRGITVTLNTMTNVKSKFLGFNGLPTVDFKFLNNTVMSGLYGLAGDNTGLGIPSLVKFAPGYSFLDNTIQRTPYVTYPPSNNIVDNIVIPTEWVCAS